MILQVSYLLPLPQDQGTRREVDGEEAYPLLFLYRRKKVRGLSEIGIDSRPSNEVYVPLWGYCRMSSGAWGEKEEAGISSFHIGEEEGVRTLGFELEA
jgi:hypothetical protein